MKRIITLLALVSVPLLLAAQTVKDILLPYIDRYFESNVILVGSVMVATQSIVSLVDKYTSFVWSKWTKILAAFLVWQLLLYLGVSYDIGFLAELGYFQGIELTWMHWLSASGLYTILSNLPIIGGLFRTKNQLEK